MWNFVWSGGAIYYTRHIFRTQLTENKLAKSWVSGLRIQDSHSDWFCHSSHLTSPQSPSPGPSTNHKPTGFPINITYLPNSRKRFNNLTVTSNMRLETSFQVQKKFLSQLKSYNGGITLAWAILVDKDQFNIKKLTKKTPNLRPWCLSSRPSSHAPSTSAGLGFSATKVRQTELQSVSYRLSLNSNLVPPTCKSRPGTWSQISF